MPIPSRFLDEDRIGFLPLLEESSRVPEVYSCPQEGAPTTRRCRHTLKSGLPDAMRVPASKRPPTHHGRQVSGRDPTASRSSSIEYLVDPRYGYLFGSPHNPARTGFAMMYAITSRVASSSRS